MKKNMVWLASYPKSGNTWFRAFLSAMHNDSVDINTLRLAPMASSRKLFEQYSGLDSSDLTLDEVERLRPDVYRMFSEACEARAYLKTHDAFTRTADHEWMFPAEVTWGAIYLVRNPLDVAVSFAHHRAASFPQTVRDLCDRDFVLSDGKRGLSVQLRQILLTWSGHVRSWLDSPNRVHLMRYEDMKNDPFTTFKRAADFLELGKSDAEIKAAIEQCEFSRLQRQELESSFKLKPQTCASFFRKGIVGEGRECLEPQHIEELIDRHREVMQELGYLDEKGRITT